VAGHVSVTYLMKHQINGECKDWRL